MPCNKKQRSSCGCNFNIKNLGTGDIERVSINGADRTALNWTEVSVPEILCVPSQKPDIENIDQVYVNATIKSVSLIETPFAYKSYDTYLTAGEIASVQAILTALTAAGIPALLTAVGVATTALTTELTTFVTANPLLGPTLNPIIASLTAAVPALTTAGTDITTAATGVTTALTGEIGYVVQNSINLLQDALNGGLVAVGEISALLVNLNAALAGVTLTPALTAAITALQTAITAVVTAIQSILNLILALVLKTKAFEIIPNAEGTCLSGRKIIIEGELDQKVIYTANVAIQSVHSENYVVPFSAFIIPYAKFEGLEYETDIEIVSIPEVTPRLTIDGFRYDPDIEINVDLCDEFCVDVNIEDIYVYAVDPRTIFKNVTVFLKAKLARVCS